MKKFFIPLLVLAAIPAVTLPAITNHTVDQAKAAETDKPCISIIGEATRELSPDKASISISIENLDTDIKAAKDKTFASFDKAVEALVENGVARESIVVENYSSYPNYDYSCGKNLIGYYSSLNFTYSVDQLDNLKATIDAVSENGLANVNNINYQLSNESELYSEALTEALNSAREKAEKLLGRTDLTLTNVEEECVYYSNTLYRCYNSAMSSQEMVGKVKIKARVKAQFC